MALPWRLLSLRVENNTDEGLLTLIVIEALLSQMRPVKARGEKFGESK